MPLALGSYTFDPVLTGGVVYHLRSEATLFWPRVRVTPWLASLYLMFYVVYK